MPWYFRRSRRVLRPALRYRCRHEGEEVAVVAAETPLLQAVDAIRAIEVEYEVLPFVVDDDARPSIPSAPAVQDGGNLVG